MRLENGGLPGEDDEGLVCQAWGFGLHPGNKGQQPKEVLVERRTRTSWLFSKIALEGRWNSGERMEAERQVRSLSHLTCQIPPALVLLMPRVPAVGSNLKPRPKAVHIKMLTWTSIQLAVSTDQALYAHYLIKSS